MREAMDSFLWGAATSSHQVEGGNDKNDWWSWEKTGVIESGVRSGVAVDHWNRFRDDLKLAQSLNLNSYRFSIEWSRIEPKKGEWDDTALDRYAEILSECESLGLVPMVTLHHFTIPQWLAAEGGFTSPDSPLLFLRFVKKVVSRIGTRVPLWCTVNEPVVLALGSYLCRFMPPAEYAPDKVGQALVNLLKMHLLAYECIHQNTTERKGPFASVPLSVGLAHNMMTFIPERAWHPMDRVLALVFDRFYNRSFLGAVIGKKQRFGIPGILKAPSQVIEAHNGAKVDFIGVNYYTKAYVQWKPRDQLNGVPPEIPIGVSFARRNEKASDLGWAIYPKGFQKAIRQAAKFGKPIYVTENGIADREDSLRSEYVELHLNEVEKAQARGIDIRGYYHWSLMDNYEWIKGFGPRFGLFHVNYETLERSQTRGAETYSNWISERSSKMKGRESEH